MCGRYTLQKTEELPERFGVDLPAASLSPNYNVASGQTMPVITLSEAGPGMELMKWGLIPFWAKDPKIGYKLINARADTIFDKPMWNKLILRKRCLVPADGFYEWKKVQEAGKPVKHPFFIRPKRYGIFAFAGIWEAWKDSEGKERRTYTIITTAPNKEMTSVHNRMPVILHQADESAWLDLSNNDRSDIEPLLRPFDDDGLEMYEVGRGVNVTSNNDKLLVTPLNSR